jgi:hypothetical protein
MRAVFTVDLPKLDGNKYPTDAQIIEVIRSFGWEPVEVCQLDDEISKLEKCRDLSRVLFEEMPPGSMSRLEHVVTYGYLADDFTRFVVIKLVEGQVTFRLANNVLSRLQTSTGKIIRKLLNAQIDGKSFRVCNQSVVIYERGNDYIVLTGRVVPDPLKETFRSDRKSVMIATVALVVFAFAITLLTVGGMRESAGLLGGTLERLSTAMLTATLVSGLNLTETYFEIYRNRIIVW